MPLIPVRRLQHQTMLVDAMNDRMETKRTVHRIQNYCNFRLPLMEYMQTTPALELATQAPPDWEGTFEFGQQNLFSPMQSFAEDITVPANTALFGMRLSEKPRFWCQWKAMGTNLNVTMTRDVVNSRVVWPNLWQNTTLDCELMRHGIRSTIILHRRPHPPSFRFSLRLSPLLNWELQDNQLNFYDNRTGTIALKMPGPSAQDVNEISITCALTRGADIQVLGTTLPTFIFTPDAAALSSAVYPVSIQ